MKELKCINCGGTGWISGTITSHHCTRCNGTGISVELKKQNPMNETEKMPEVNTNITTQDCLMHGLAGKGGAIVKVFESEIKDLESFCTHQTEKIKKLEKENSQAVELFEELLDNPYISQYFADKISDFLSTQEKG